MGPNFKYGVICSSFVITILLVVGALLGKSKAQDGAYRPLAVFTEVLARIKSDYVEEPNIPKVTLGALQGLVEYLDPVSSYLSADQFEEYRSGLETVDEGSGLSTGMVVRKQGAYTTVLAVLPGSAADQAGIQADDVLDAIDNVSTRVMPPAYLLARLSGDAGNKVTVMVRHSSDYDSPKEHVLVRSEPILPPVALRMLADNVAYIDVDVLGPEQLDQLRDGIGQLESEGATGIVLDLRGNAQGTAEDGIAVADLFISEGPLAVLSGKNFAEKIYGARPDTTVTDLPVAVIIDRPTSGGAEVAATAIQRSGRGEAVGEQSSGVAALRETLTLDGGAALILTVAKFHGPDGEPIHSEGLEPSLSVSQRDLRRYREVRHREFDTPEAREEALEEAGDPFLDKALEALGKSSAPA